MCLLVYRGLLGGHVMVIHSVQGFVGRSCDGHSQCACMYTGVIHNVFVVIHNVRVVIHKVCVCVYAGACWAVT